MDRSTLRNLAGFSLQAVVCAGTESYVLGHQNSIPIGVRVYARPRQQGWELRMDEPKPMNTRFHGLAPHGLFDWGVWQDGVRSVRLTFGNAILKARVDDEGRVVWEEEGTVRAVHVVHLSRQELAECVGNATLRDVKATLDSLSSSEFDEFGLERFAVQLLFLVLEATRDRDSD